MPRTFTSILKKSTGIFSFLLLITCAAFSQTIKGKVTDAVTGEPMVGATVKVMETSSKHFVQLDGTFTIKNIKPGSYQLQLSYLSYKTELKQVTVNASGTSTVSIQMEPNVSELSMVTIGMAGKSDRKARDREKNADPLLNVVSARTIQLSSDLTVANVMQRVSGVTIEKNSSGEGRYPIIRGMEKRYINTLVNGIKIPSPDNKNRYVPLDLFPSEILDRLEVSKSLTPSMEGDAIGGTINLVMKDAPSRLMIEGNYAAGYNNIFDSQPYKQFSTSGISKYSPAEINGNNYAAQVADFPRGTLNYTTKNTPVNMTAGLTIGNRFGKDKKFGFIVSGSYQNNYRGTSSTFFLPNAQPNVNNIPSFQELQQRQYSSQSTRLGINTKLDYQINPKNKISIYNLYVNLKDIQERYIVDTIVLNTIVNYQDRSTVQHQSINSSTLQGNHDLNNGLKLDWSLVYSIANNRLPDQAYFSQQYGSKIDSQTGLLTRDKDNTVQKMNRLWMANSDKDYSAYVNITQQGLLLQRKIELKAGAVFRDKKRNNIYNEYSLSPVPSPQVYSNINDATFTVDNGGLPSISGNNYTFKEDLTEAYAQIKWQLLHKLEMLGGVRIEQTHQHYDTQLAASRLYRFGTIDYTDVLPSLQFKYALTETQNLRLAYYKALTRPSFIDLIPDGVQGEVFKEEGNPAGLNHTTANNIDFRYEFFPGSSDQILIGAFYKNIKDPIEYTAEKPPGTVTTLTLIPENFGNATNFGLEAVVTKYFGPFGISANYTFTRSRITTNKLFSYVGDKGPTSKLLTETRPLQGQSDHVGNLSLLYKNPKIGLDIQIAGVYTGARIALVNPYYGLDYWQAPTTQLDASFEKSVIKRFSIYGKVNNITNTPMKLELHKSYAEYLASTGSMPLDMQTDPNKFVVQKDYFKTSFLLGVRYKL